MLEIHIPKTRQKMFVRIKKKTQTQKPATYSGFTEVLPQPAVCLAARSLKHEFISIQKKKEVTEKTER